MDHLTYYGLTHDPFDKESSSVFETVDLKEVSARLDYVTKTLGICVITGSSGSGKTFALRHFASKLNPSLYRVCYLQLATVTMSDFYDAIGTALGLELPRKKIDKFHQIQERIVTLYEKNKVTPIFIFDEAQYLKGPILQELVMLFNFEMDSKKNCLIILTGLPYLAQMLERAQFEPLKQRVIAKYEVVGIEAKEVQSYLDAQFRHANRSTPVFTEAAVEALRLDAGTSIRKLNNIVTHSLILGAKKNQAVIDTDIIYAANREVNFS